MKKLLMIFVSIFVGIECLGSDKKILISQTIEHPALNVTTQGITDSLNEKGYRNIRIESAQGNVILASQIAAKFVNQKPDIVIGVGTISAQSFIKYAKAEKIKLVFSSVTDPEAASLIVSDGNISGVSNFVDIKPQIELFKMLQPNLKNLGILYNPIELNSVSIVKKLESLCFEYDIELVKQVINKTSDAAQAANNIANKVDAIFISNDNTALSAFSTITKIASKAMIPVYVSDTDSVKLGALAAFGPNQYNIGRQTGDLVAKLLDGENINSSKVEYPKDKELYFNEEVAKELNIQLPQKIRSKATIIVKSKKS